MQFIIRIIFANNNTKLYCRSLLSHLRHELQTRSHRICELEEHGNSNLVFQEPVVDGLGGAAELGTDCFEVEVVELHLDEEGIELL